MFDLELSKLVTFAGIWAAAASAPGGNTAFTVSISSRYGFLAGLVGAAGFVSALLVYMLVVAFGLDFAIAQYKPILGILSWVGVAYLVYLAYKMWTANTSARLGGEFEVGSRLKIYIQGALICFTNPKVMLFVAFVFPNTIVATQPLLPQFIMLGVCGALLSFAIHGAYSTFGHVLGQSVPTPAARRISNRAIAVVFLIAAGGLALASY